MVRSSSRSPAPASSPRQGVRSELAEDLTARAVQSMREAHRSPRRPAHIRSLTSPMVVAVENHLTQSPHRPRSAAHREEPRHQRSVRVRRRPGTGHQGALRVQRSPGHRGRRRFRQDQHPRRGPRPPERPGEKARRGHPHAQGGTGRQPASSTRRRIRQQPSPMPTASAGTTTADGPDRPGRRPRTWVSDTWMCSSSTRPECSTRTPRRSGQHRQRSRRLPGLPRGQAPAPRPSDAGESSTSPPTAPPRSTPDPRHRSPLHRPRVRRPKPPHAHWREPRAGLRQPSWPAARSASTPPKSNGCRRSAASKASSSPPRREQVAGLNATAPRIHRRSARDGDEIYTSQGEAIGVGDVITTETQRR